MMKRRSLLFFALLFSCNLYSEDALKDLSNILKAEDATGAAELVIDDPKLDLSQADLGKKMAQRDMQRLRSDQLGLELLKDIRITHSYQSNEGVPMPSAQPPEVMLDDATAKLKGEGYGRTDIIPCRKSRIIKRPGSNGSKTVWLDMLYNFDDTFDPNLDLRKVYGDSVIIRRLSRTAPPYQIDLYRGEGVTCVPFRIRVVGDAEYRLYGDVALRKY